MVPRKKNKRKLQKYKLALYRTDGRLFATDVSAKFTESHDTETRKNIKNPAKSNLDIVP